MFLLEGYSIKELNAKAALNADLGVLLVAGFSSQG